LALLNACSDPPSNRLILDIVRLAQGKVRRPPVRT
jgi:hypothetical protein